MNKAQALALMTAMETNKISASAVMTFDAALNETWQVALDPKRTYSGVELGKLTDYCATNGLTLSIAISQMGVT